MLVFSAIMFWVILGCITSWVYILAYLINERYVDSFLRKKEIKISSIPAILILIGLIWPISISVIILVSVYSLIKMFYSTFRSLYYDIKNIIKGKST